MEIKNEKNQQLHDLAEVIAPVAHLLSEHVKVHENNRQGILEPTGPLGFVLKDTLSVLDAAFNQPSANTPGGNIVPWYVSQRVLDEVCDMYGVSFGSEDADKILQELITTKREKDRNKGQDAEFSSTQSGLKTDKTRSGSHYFVIEHMYPRTLFAKHVVQVNADGVNVEATKRLLDKISMAWVTRDEHDWLEKTVRPEITVLDENQNIKVGPYNEIFAEYSHPKKADSGETIKLLDFNGIAMN